MDFQLNLINIRGLMNRSLWLKSLLTVHKFVEELVKSVTETQYSVPLKNFSFLCNEFLVLRSSSNLLSFNSHYSLDIIVFHEVGVTISKPPIARLPANYVCALAPKRLLLAQVGCSCLYIPISCIVGLERVGVGYW